MCGIVGAIAQRNIVPVIVEGLKRLEYRGYDSAGAAVLHDGKLERVRRVGRVAEMEAQVAAQHLEGGLGIGHTRWATHGGVTEFNAHPHISKNEIAVVHNGIIENHEQQRTRLKALGYVFESQTDTEVIAHLVHHYYSQSHDLLDATRRTVAELHGAYAIGVVAMDSTDPQILHTLRVFDRRHPVDGTPTHPVWHALRAQRSILVPSVSDASIASRSRSASWKRPNSPSMSA